MKKILIIVFGILAFFLNYSSVSAEEINVTVSDNGSGSDNSVNLQVQTDTNITQKNTSNITNNVNQNLNTGNNYANDNNADVGISTGNVSSQTSISNNTNYNQANLDGCFCQQPVSIEVSGNGSYSVNQVNSKIINNADIASINNAYISNNVKIKSNTGENFAKNNLGGVYISTGNINIDGKVINKANITVVNIGSSNSGGVSIVNNFNGADSNNEINFDLENILNIYKYNFAQVDNQADIITNTGGNLANGNGGDVVISTGDIDINFEIINDPINQNVISIGGEIPKDIPSPQIPPATPSTNPTSTVIAAASSAPGQILAAATASLLPATGPSHLMFLFAIWTSLFCFGLLLRRISGLAPPNILALV